MYIHYPEDTRNLFREFLSHFPNQHSLLTLTLYKSALLTASINQTITQNIVNATRGACTGTRHISAL
jgi:hypothetical protein